MALGLKGQRSRLGLGLTAIRHGFEPYECLLVANGGCIYNVLGSSGYNRPLHHTRNFRKFALKIYAFSNNLQGARESQKLGANTLLVPVSYKLGDCTPVPLIGASMT